MLKCMCVGTALAFVWQFSRGRTHYLKYLRKGLQGTLFGVVYSFYFLARKVENEQVEQMIKRMEQENLQGKILPPLEAKK